MLAKRSEITLLLIYLRTLRTPLHVRDRPQLLLVAEAPLPVQEQVQVHGRVRMLSV